MASLVGAGLRLDVADLDRLAYQTGTGQVELQHEIIRLALIADDGARYSDAQLDDYHLDGFLRWRPPVRLSVKARFLSPLRGTAGFGFWNDPFGMTKIGTGSRYIPRVRLPQAVWYFYASPPSQMLFAQGVPGYGWKAATIDGGNLMAKLLLPLAPFGMLACRVPWLYRRLWPLAQRVLKIDEALVPADMEGWHEYAFEWGINSIRFTVDGETLFRTRFSPSGPLGFVAWIDNQFMIATPQGRFKHGVVAAATQSMELTGLEVQAL